MIYLVRHGLDDESYIGGYSDVDLIAGGIVQVNNLGLWLKENSLNINRIYTSDIKRAFSTAKIINSYLNLPVIKSSELRELDKGLLTGLKKEIAKLMYPDYINLSNIDVSYPEGESMLDFYYRIKELFIDISSYDKSLIVTHRGVINMIYTLINNDNLSMDKEKYGVEHASVHELNLVKSRIRRIR